MNADRHFFDTNVLIYTFDADSPEKATRAEDLIHAALASGLGMISYQVAQEFVAVARGRFRTPMTFEEIDVYWESTLRPLLTVHSSPSLFLSALDLCRTGQLSWYDSLIVAAAQQGRCQILYSEDFQHGRRFGDLRVEDPFQ
jgi:predicted nucleic acid-binding protein